MPLTNTTINNERRTIESDEGRSLLEVLREDLHLTGTKYGCGEGECGACSVLVDGECVRSCSTELAAVEGKTLITIEGMSNGERLHPVQQAFLLEGAFQCGYCTPGMIIAATALLTANPSPSDAEITQAMDGNLCRCCGYQSIVSAIRRAADLLAKEGAR